MASLELDLCVVAVVFLDQVAISCRVAMHVSWSSGPTQAQTGSLSL